MIPLFLILLAAIGLSVILQEFLPALTWLHGARIYITPILVVYGALALPFPLMLLLVFWAGFLWDALHVQILESRVEFSLGWSILLYAILGGVMQGLRPMFLKGRWEIHCLASGVGTSFLLLCEFLMINLRRSGFEFPMEAWWRIGGPGLIALLLAPPFYIAFRLLEQKLGTRAGSMERRFS